jgi:Omp85 superfamily domain
VSLFSARLTCRNTLVVAVLLLPVAAAGQESRTDAHEQAQEARAAAATAPTHGFVERAIREIKRVGLFGSAPVGLHPVFSTVYPGGWMGPGIGYRAPIGDTGRFDVVGVWSVKNFRKVAASVGLPSWRGGPFDLSITGSWINAPSVDFYGIGNNSQDEERATYAYRPATVGLTATAPWKALTVGGGVGYLTVDVDPSLDVLPDAQAPLATTGLGDRSRYLRTRGLVTVDWRRTPGYTGSGGLYRLELQDNVDRSGLDRGFRSVEGEVVQLIPILRANWVIALRGLATITDADAADRVPFYLMPSIGGNNSVRGYPSLRFLGNHRLLLSGEYRWTAARFLDMAVFYDAGKVALDVDELDLRDLRHAYGIGARFHGAERTVLRLELARNDAGGWRMVCATGAAF